jgi:hypothetical protein
MLILVGTEYLRHGEYLMEDAMLQAVSEGDTKRALYYLSQYKGYTREHRTADSIRDRRNGFIVLNLLARKAVENSYVHPAHIHTISDDFARRIKSASLVLRSKVSGTTKVSGTAKVSDTIKGLSRWLLRCRSQRL